MSFDGIKKLFKSDSPKLGGRECAGTRAFGAGTKAGTEVSDTERHSSTRAVPEIH